MRKTELVRDSRLSGYSVEESFKTIRANLLFCGTDHKAVLMTSCQPGEGKTTVTAALACSLSDIGKKVLLIDADLRKSVLMTRLAPSLCGDVPGMSEYLSGQASLDEVLYATQYDSLSLIFAGRYPPNPAELCASERFRSLLEEMRKEYDYILIDTAPVGVVIDAAMIAPFCDGAVLVLSLGRNTLRGVRAAQQQIEKSGCKMMGVILNDTRRASSVLSRRNKEYYAYRADGKADSAAGKSAKKK